MLEGTRLAIRPVAAVAVAAATAQQQKDDGRDDQDHDQDYSSGSSRSIIKCSRCLQFQVL